MSLQGITYLIEKCFNGTATVAEQQLLAELINRPENEMEARKAIRFLLDKEKELQDLPEVTALAIQEVILGVDKKQSLLRKLSKKAARWVAAAVLIIAIGSGVYYWGRSSKLKVVSNKLEVVKNDILPGGNRAFLTIGDQTIALSDDKEGIINKENQLTYSDGSSINGTTYNSQLTTYNSLTTPRGGQYQAVLPDGSRVWLNAASSIKFPSKFTNSERRVEVTGEVYFEIAKDAKRPFKVFGGEQEIEVLGTSFNINMYDDEPIKKTTLITGSIKITTNNQTAILKPGQQANIPILSILPIRLIQVQTSDVIAWKNGYFSFNQTTLDVILKQLSRWYDIEIEYNAAISQTRINGQMGRDLDLSEALDVLKALGIQGTLKNNRLIITKKK